MSTYALGQFNTEGETRLTRWQSIASALERLRSQVNKAEVEEMNARNKFGKFFTPEDAKPGEIFNVWLGSTLIEITTPSGDSMNYKVNFRKGGIVA